jgi:hypothetical protein
MQAGAPTSAPATERGPRSAQSGWSRSRPGVDDGVHCFPSDAELGEDAGRDRVGDADHAEQHVFVAERRLGGVVEGIGECQLQPWADAEAASARAFERTRPECLLEPLAYLVEVDPEPAQSGRSLRAAMLPGSTLSAGCRVCHGSLSRRTRMPA